MEIKNIVEIQDRIDECLSRLDTLMKLIIEVDSDHAPFAFVVEPLLDKARIDLYSIAGMASRKTENS